MKHFLVVLLILAAVVTFTYASDTPSGLTPQPGHSRSVDPWVPEHPCVNNSIYSQPPNNPGDIEEMAFTSDILYGYKIFDDFYSVNGPVCNLHWWGTNLIYDYNTLMWMPCDDENIMTFVIQFWGNTNGMPDSVYCTYTIRATRTNVGLLQGSYPLYSWNVVLDPCCQITSGWVSIQGVSGGNPDCAFLWATSPLGNNVMWQMQPNGEMASYDTFDMAFCLTGQEEMDLGDVVLNGVNWPQLGYPTLPGNPGHVLSGIAWLGASISGEAAPLIQNIDPFDDGVIFPNGMIPCQPATVLVTITAGPNYNGQPLFLEAWKDGNLDGDFCDTLCPSPTHFGGAPEWIIQDQPVSPGTWPFTFMDPGLRDVPPYDGVFRFRLCSVPTGPLGFGLGVPGTPMCQGTWGVDYLGEVEDYYFFDYQLAVELLSFNAEAGSNMVTLLWQTASETDNDHFDLLRNGELIATVNTKGNGSDGHTYSYVDNHVVNGTTYDYLLFAQDINGNRQQVGHTTATPVLTAEILHDYALQQNYPNPFNAVTNLAFELKESGIVHLSLFNLTGQKVAEIVNGFMDADRHEVQFDAKALPSGVYIYRLEVNGFSAEKKMLLIK
jgi:hypothetical protein